MERRARIISVLRKIELGGGLLLSLSVINGRPKYPDVWEFVGLVTGTFLIGIVWILLIELAIRYIGKRRTNDGTRESSSDFSRVQQELQKKALYRFCKLCYGCAYVISVAVVLYYG